MTDNALPRFHKFGRNVLGFSGYNGRGIAPGTTFGKLLARHVLGEVSQADLPLPLTEVQEPGFRAVKEAYYEAGAQIAHFTGERF
jgi:glycine/D-amino acid oxidase-like deaminating enzyme